MHDDSLLYQVSELYFVQGMTMGAVADRFQVSRSTVSRMLALAKERGIVTVSLRMPSSPSDLLSRRMHDLFGIRIHVAGTARTAPAAQRLEAVSRYAAHLVGEWVTDGSTLGVAWGTTTSQVASHLQPSTVRDVTVVQLNGAAGPHSTGVGASSPVLSTMARAFNAELYAFPTPAFFDLEQTRTLLWQESSVRRILAVRSAADLAVFSVGAFQGPVLSQVYSEGHLSPATLRSLHENNVVGDMCTVFIREDGTYADIDLNRRASGPTPSELARIPRRLCVASGRHKVRGILGALRSGAVTDLVIDDRTATQVLAHLETQTPARPTAAAATTHQLD
ncbi:MULTISPECIES: sugar-binding transcriptional regulator [Kocuria]|uniref:Transcriptional regulator n=1 Tax=Kocuria subflava TaxID=1736139 RepID=A0A846TS98_9MICC|nr:MULTISPECIES: sugar-binding domain-containing protein [unclassified Kocuria]NKE08704.1 transcriptional regulator [Kocuria subflava]